MKVDEVKFIEYYEQAQRNYKEIERLINDESFRRCWCKKYKIQQKYICIGQLKRDLERERDILNFMRIFIQDERQTMIYDEVHQIHIKNHKNYFR